MQKALVIIKLCAFRIHELGEGIFLKRNSVNASLNATVSNLLKTQQCERFFEQISEKFS